MVVLQRESLLCKEPLLNLSKREAVRYNLVMGASVEMVVLSTTPVVLAIVIKRLCHKIWTYFGGALVSLEIQHK